MYNDKQRCEMGTRISKHTLIVNFILSIIKIVVGLISKSQVMIADGVHTISDVLTTFGVIVGLKLSTQPDDKNHPYGHEKIEPIVSKILAVFLCITALTIMYTGINTIIKNKPVVPSMLAIYGAIISIISKEWMYRYTVKGAIKIHSQALKADAWHHRSDALSSVGALIGIIGARLGYPILDPLAAIVVGIIIIKVSIEIYIVALNQLIDRAADDNLIIKIKQKIIEIKGVINIDNLKTRQHANKIYVDVEISVKDNLTVKEGHKIAEEVHQQIEGLNNTIKHCMVHVNPFTEGKN